MWGSRVTAKDRERRGLQVGRPSSAVKENGVGKRRGRERCRSVNNLSPSVMAREEESREPSLVSAVRVVRDGTPGDPGVSGEGMFFGGERRSRRWEVDRSAQQAGVSVSWGIKGSRAERVSSVEVPRRRLVAGNSSAAGSFRSPEVKTEGKTEGKTVGLGLVFHEGSFAGAGKKNMDGGIPAGGAGRIGVRWLLETSSTMSLAGQEREQRGVTAQAMGRRLSGSGSGLSFSGSGVESRETGMGWGFMPGERQDRTVRGVAQCRVRGHRVTVRKRKRRCSVPKKRGYGTVGSAIALHAIGHEFESHYLQT
jgi:hypothetical protein